MPTIKVKRERRETADLPNRKIVRKVVISNHKSANLMTVSSINRELMPQSIYKEQLPH
jgi:hypothetical protein